MSDTQQIEITRLIDAPSELVFRCWLEPDHLVHWYNAGSGWTTPYAETDPRTGGRFKIGFAGPDGKVAFDFTGHYGDVTPPAPGKTGRLAFTIDDGRPVIVLFEDRGGKTFVSLTLTLETTHSAEQQRHGWGAMLENLSTHLAQTAGQQT